VVHRDFKPDNVLIDREGRVRVVDFGLAATADSSDLHDLHDVPLTASARGLAGNSINARLAAGLQELASGSHGTLAATGGALVGTPAYMAPEQHLGAAPDARADQYSFCAALYEGLYGERPVPGATLGELRHNLLAGVIHSPGPGSPVPPWLRRVLLRGLSLDPDRRYPAMSDLLADLARDPDLTRRRVALALVVGLAVVAALALGYAARRGQDELAAESLAARRRECAAQGPALIAAAWSADRRAAAERALLATGLPYAGDTWARVRPRLDAYAQALSDMSVETCTSAHVREDMPLAAHDERMACLRRLAAELGGLSDALAAADARTVERAVQAAVALPPPTRCDDPDPRAGGADPQRAAAVEDLGLRLARARARAAAGQFAAAAADAAGVAEAAAALGEAGAQAEALLRRGSFQEAGGEFPAAEATLEGAYFLAESAARDDLRAEIAVALVGVVGVRLSRPADARKWLRHAWAVGERVRIDRELRVRLLSVESGVLRVEQAREPAAGKIAEALTIAEQTFAADDPRLAAVVLNAGVNLFDRGDYLAAEQQYLRALAILEGALGEVHPDLAPTLNNLGSVREKLGRFPAAIAAIERALAIREASVGAGHPGVAVSLTNLGQLHLRLDDAARAEPEFRRAAAIFEAALGPGHPNLASALGGLGRALVRQGKLAEARPLHLRAREILERALGPDHPLVAFPLLDLADLDLAAGAAAPAIPLATRALELRRGENPEDQAAAAFALARALHAAGQQPARVATLAASAEQTLRGAGPGFQPELTQVEAFRRTLPEDRSE
jgi:tetratricopeptide (TPR) repeat protein